MLSDRTCRYPRFKNLNFTVPVDVVWVNSYGNILFNPARVPVRVSVNKLSCPKADNVRPHWRFLERLRFGFVKAVYPYRAP